MDSPLSISCRETLQPLDVMTTSRKPKLSLKTSGLTPSYNVSMASRNAASTDAITTPTTMNTYVNTFDLAHRPSPVSTIPSPATQVQQIATGHPPSPTTTSPGQPYSVDLPYGLRPILKNSPLPKDLRRPSCCSASPTSWVPGRRIFFPPPKKVTFRVILEEEIVTTDYVRCHVDLSTSEDDTCLSEVEEESIASTGDDGKGLEERVVHVDEYSTCGGRKRKSTTSSDAVTGDWRRGREERPRSKCARRRKRKRRRWELSAELGLGGNGTPARQEGERVKVEAFIDSQPRPPDERTEALAADVEQV
ncbi:hypothetical protein A1O3_02527 [Capronia epimyces CBS 606.96]|uniref:Uncharacterized protein n=1 Tax=Capronia epimyces CBS 606.96 TaxID=1182542 RepID=W9YIH5_9EURO|nr:uncharacterized protein A1O3_02527 [Capronia epimyces CBS 606.96]EXJ89460.1 hypothetical protein A1O3_02527 [Capronia epimyces CBS 606.96]